MMKVLFILLEENEDWSHVVGVTDSKEWAHAFTVMDQFRSSLDNKSLEVMTLNVLDGKLLARIEEWLDPARNPLCTCGHRKLHHRARRSRRYNYPAKVGEGSCKHNRRHGGKEFIHACKGFTMAEKQQRISFDRSRGGSSLTPGEWREQVDAAIVSALQEE
jgi:hypothetical protein